MNSSSLRTSWTGIVLLAGLATACAAGAADPQSQGPPSTTVTSTPVTSTTPTSTTVPPATVPPATVPPTPLTTDAPTPPTATLPASTEDCRADATCPSSEHRTSDACGAELIHDVDGYLEGRHDAEDGRPYQVDNAPAPTAADDDDDDATVGPQTRYRAGYAQGWCDGSAA